MALNCVTRQGMRALLVAILFATVFAISFVYVPEVFAQDVDLGVGLDSVGTTAGLSSTPLPVIIGRIIGVFLSFLGIVLLGFIIYAGFMWMTAGGNPEKLEKAKKILINAIVGLVIVLTSFAIANFVVSAITGGQGIFGGGEGGAGGTGGPPIEVRSGSFGRGAISDHSPRRGATDVARNTKIFVTFKDQMNIESFIEGYDNGGTPLDVSDDVVATALNTNNIKIYVTEDGVGEAFTSEEISVGFSHDLRTVVFSPPILGSNSVNVNYTVLLGDSIQNAAGRSVLNSGGYEWHFRVGTKIDDTPPTVISVTPRADGIYDRNILVQINFSEIVDLTSATGIYDPASLVDNFKNIRVKDSSGGIIPGSYVISNEYRTVTFTSLDTCGQNSCGEDMFCLPGGMDITVEVLGATLGLNPPQTDIFPYNGVVDASANSLDGNGDGTAGDAYEWAFTTSSDINTGAPAIESISPAIGGIDVDLDQPIVITFDSIMSSSSIGAENIEILPDPDHEMWYGFSSRLLTAIGEPAGAGDDAVKTQVTARHGVFLESSDEQTYRYSVNISSEVRNQYQNCYSPAEGPGASGPTCGTDAANPYCCNGVPSSSACSFF